MSEIVDWELFFNEAAARKGGHAALESLLPKPRTRQSLSRSKDRVFLDAMAKGIFRAGFNWSVVDKKWPQIEEAMYAFDPPRVAFLSDVDISELSGDSRMIRHRAKIESVVHNARLVVDTAKEHGGFGRFVARWPDDDVVGLWAWLKKEGSRLGGRTGPYFLREVGKDTFLLSRDVVRALIRYGVVDKEPTAKRDLQRVEEAFSAWRQQSGRSYGELSRALACTVP
jgi:3-methyladenine DNA glycosylase Tag